MEAYNCGSEWKLSRKGEIIVNEQKVEEAGRLILFVFWGIFLIIPWEKSHLKKEKENKAVLTQ